MEQQEKQKQEQNELLRKKNALATEKRKQEETIRINEEANLNAKKANSLKGPPGPPPLNLV